jgi:hypothetical protein
VFLERVLYLHEVVGDWLSEAAIRPCGESDLLDDEAVFRRTFGRTSGAAPSGFAQVVMARVQASAQVTREKPRHGPWQKLVGVLMVALTSLVAASLALTLVNSGLVLSVIAIAISVIIMVANLLHPVMTFAGDLAASPVVIVVAMATPLVVLVAGVVALPRVIPREWLSGLRAR